MARNVPHITHLLFADDSLLFAHANEREAETILKILHSYQAASGQIVNFDKSDMSYIRNMPIQVKEMIYNKIGIKSLNHHAKYLGLPVVFGRSKNEVFSLVQDKVWKKVMSCYKVPDGTCKEIESLMAKFWWGSTNSQRKIHWISWGKMGTAKS